MVKMKCHYDVLEVSRQADETEIKTAYRKLALKWHPDKNLDNPEEAKEEFQLVQQAYEILSDRQERAWYDNHRDQILRGNDSDFKDEAFDVFPFFTTTCFHGYMDDVNGFYAVYRNVFEKIKKEDLEYVEDEEFFEIPSFGMASSNYEEVVAPFYNYWLNYKTKKTYVWLDLHGINEIHNRKIFKVLEKENKKVRQKAQKERNDEVRALVAFVRKRDKRVQQYCKKLESKVIENRQKQEEISRQRRIERQKELSDYKAQAEWTKFDNVKMELENIEKDLAEEFGETLSAEESDDEIEKTKLDHLYCIACNKVFKTEKSFENHELSKKHKENIEKLKCSMIDDFDEVEDEETGEENFNEVVPQMDINPYFQKSVYESKKQKKKQRKSRNVIDLNSIEIDENDDNINECISKVELEKCNEQFDEPVKQKRKNRNKVKKIISLTNSSNEECLLNENKTESNEIEESLIKTKNKKYRQQESESKIDSERSCVMCKSNFPSKNKLFEHLKKTGHTVYIPTEPSKKEKKKLIKGK